MLWLRTLVFTILVPGTELVLIPFAVISSGIGPHLDSGNIRFVGFVPIVIGIAAIALCFTDFIRRGHGTPAPYDPPRTLVVGGLYKRVRNPQYLGVLLVTAGEALLSGALILWAYAAVLGFAFHIFVSEYEEPTLDRLFGEDYVQYCEAVPRWLLRS